MVKKNKDNKNEMTFAILTTVQPNNSHVVHKSSFTSLEWSIYTVQMKRQAESVHV